MDMRIHPLELILIMFESNPLKSIMLVRRLAVLYEEFTKLAETRAGSRYLNLGLTSFKLP